MDKSMSCLFTVISAINSHHFILESTWTFVPNLQVPYVQDIALRRVDDSKAVPSGRAVAEHKTRSYLKIEFVCYLVN